MVRRYFCGRFEFLEARNRPVMAGVNKSRFKPTVHAIKERYYKKYVGKDEDEDDTMED